MWNDYNIPGKFFKKAKQNKKSAVYMLRAEERVTCVGKF